MDFPQLKIGDLVAKIPVIQGGMGVGISLSGLASAVAKEGGIGVIVDKRLDVLWKAATAVSAAWIYKAITDARVAADAFSHQIYVRPHALADTRDLVYEADFSH